MDVKSEQPEFNVSRFWRDWLTDQSNAASPKRDRLLTALGNALTARTIDAGTVGEVWDALQISIHNWRFSLPPCQVHKRG